MDLPSDAWPRIRGYEILAFVGRGDMSRVFKAKEQTADRIVALKVLAPDADDKELSRFRSESQAVAPLHHANIAAILDTGDTDDGRPYFAMEYVEQGSLASILAGRPQPSLEAAALVETLARALHHCHRQGIVHRNLTPANILMKRKDEGERIGRKDEGGRMKDERDPASSFLLPASSFIPKIADFGLGRQVPGSDVFGTPCYLAPEQASDANSQFGPGADIYALGSILYEMLTGRPPLQGPGDTQTLAMVQTMEPVAPRRLQPDVPRDLETICLKCLDKSPRGRYATAHELAEDLHRFRAGKPIVAQPAGSIQRLRKWARRHPGRAVALGVFLVFLGVLLVGMAEVHQANTALTEANEDLKRSVGGTQQGLTMARDALDRMLVRFADQGAPSPQAEQLRRDSLMDARNVYRKVSELRPFDDVSRRNVAEALIQLGKIERELGHNEPARDAFLKAQSSFEELRQQMPNDLALRRSLLAVAHGLAGVEYEERGRDVAEPILRQAIQDLQPLVESNDAGIFKIGSGLHQSLGSMMYSASQREKSRSEAEQQKLAQAENEYRAALALRHRWLQLEPKALEPRAAVISSHSDLAMVLQSRKRPAEVVEHLTSALGLLDKPTEPSRRNDLGQMHGRLAAAYEMLEQPTDALREHAAALATFEALVADYKSVPDYRHRLGREHRNLARYLADRGKTDEALKHLRLAIPLFEQLTRDFPGQRSYADDLAICHALEVAINDTPGKRE